MYTFFQRVTVKEKKSGKESINKEQGKKTHRKKGERKIEKENEKYFYRNSIPLRCYLVFRFLLV
jgi:hypothetical protein